MRSNRKTYAIFVNALFMLHSIDQAIK